MAIELLPDLFAHRFLNTFIRQRVASDNYNIQLIIHKTDSGQKYLKVTPH